MASASANENTGQTTGYTSSFARKTQLEATYPDLRIFLKGFWIALVPCGMLPYEPRGLRLSRWRLGCLLDDVESAIAAKADRRWLTLRHRAVLYCAAPVRDRPAPRGPSRLAGP